MPDEMSEVGLAEAVAAIRRDLVRAQAEGAGEDVRFVIGNVEMEFCVDVTREAGAGVSVKVISLISLGAKGRLERTETHRVKVVLAPQTVDGRPFEVASADSSRPGG